MIRRSPGWKRRMPSAQLGWYSSTSIRDSIACAQTPGSKIWSSASGSRINGSVAMPSVRTTDGVNISYETLGEGPRHVLFMHGWGGAGSGHSWKELLKHLDLTGLRLILVDLRG